MWRLFIVNDTASLNSLVRVEGEGGKKEGIGKAREEKWRG